MPITQGQQEIPDKQGRAVRFHQVEKARSFLKDWTSKWVRIEQKSASCAIDPDAVLYT